MNYVIIYANQDLILEGLGVIELIKQTAVDENPKHKIKEDELSSNSNENHNLLSPYKIPQID